MNINAKIISLLVVSFFIVSALFAFTSINALKRSQTENMKLFKEEFLELGRELFENSSNLFFYDLDLQSKIKDKDQTIAQRMLNFIKKIDPQGKNIVVINIADKRFLESYSNPEIVTLLSRPVIENYLHENILNQKTDFDLDNFKEFALDTTNTVAPSKIHLRIYDEAGLIIGYNKTFVMAKVRIQFIERQNQIVFKSYLVSSLVIFMSTMIIAVIFMIIFMRSIVIRPLKIIASGLKQVQEDELETRLDIKKKDEMGQIAIAFNSMTSDLKRSREELENYAKNLEEKVSERTKELEAKNIELKKINKLMVGRELRMIELKEKIAVLSEKHKI